MGYELVIEHAGHGLRVSGLARLRRPARCNRLFAPFPVVEVFYDILSHDLRTNRHNAADSCVKEMYTKEQKQSTSHVWHKSDLPQFSLSRQD